MKRFASGLVAVVLFGLACRGTVPAPNHRDLTEERRAQEAAFRRLVDAREVRFGTGRLMPGPFAHVWVRDDFSCGVLANGMRHCWGIREPRRANAFACAVTPDGRLDRGMVARYTPTRTNLREPPAAGSVHGTSVGCQAACALDSSGRAQCWGDIDNPASHPPTTEFAELGVGFVHACGRTRDGAIQCWGDGGYHDGLGPFDLEWLHPEPQPAPVVPPLGRPPRNVPRVAELVGTSGSILYERDPLGYVFSWMPRKRDGIRGRAFRHVLGWWGATAVGPYCRCSVSAHGGVDCSDDVRPFPRSRTFESIAVGGPGPIMPCGDEDPPSPCLRAALPIPFNSGCYACAIDTQGGATCVGGQQAPSGRFQSIAVGTTDACGLRSDGRARCWGEAALPPLPGQYSQIAIGLPPRGYQTCGLHLDGTVQCWAGRDRPLAWHASDPCLTPVSCGFDSPNGVRFTRISSGARHNCGITVEGTAQCWGHSTAGELVAPSGPFKSVVAADDFSCGMRPSGSVECWGKGFTFPPRDPLELSGPSE